MTRRSGAFSAGREVSIALLSYGAYLAVRRLVWNERGRQRAQHNAELVLAAERKLGLDQELRVQSAALKHPKLIHLLNAAYAAGNVALSVGWLIMLFRKRSNRFERERSAAVLAFTGALPFFALFPTAPPRTRDDVVDVLGAGGIDIEHPALVMFYNPIAAMPSHHVAFATVTGIGLASSSGHPIARGFWTAYPALVTWVVLATGNHFSADAAGGMALGVVARAVTR